VEPLVVYYFFTFYFSLGISFFTFGFRRIPHSIDTSKGFLFASLMSRKNLAFK
jgi:hypothetical protein